MSRLICVVVGLVLCWSAGCKKGRLVSDKEIDAELAAHDELVAKYKARSCPRPPLRGRAKAGSGTEALAAFANKKGPHHACLESLEDNIPDGASTVMTDCSKSKHKKDCPARELADEPQKEAVKKVLDACGGMLTELRQLVSYGDVCSLYPPGEIPDPLMKYIYAVQITGLQARKLAREGRTTPAVELALDALRFGQDMHRKGSSLIGAMIAVATARAPMYSLEAILNAKLAWTTAQLDSIDAQIALLTKTQISWSETIVGESLHHQAEIARNIRKEKKAAERDVLGIQWFAARKNDELTEQTCRDTNMKDCVTKSKQWPKRFEPTSSGRRAKEIATARTIMSSPTWKYAKKNSQALGRMIGLKAHLAYVRMTLASGVCPKASALQPMLSSKALGDGLTTVVASDGTIELRLPEWAVLTDKDAHGRKKMTVPHTIWHIRCPI